MSSKCQYCDKPIKRSDESKIMDWEGKRFHKECFCKVEVIYTYSGKETSSTKKDVQKSQIGSTVRELRKDIKNILSSLVKDQIELSDRLSIIENVLESTSDISYPPYDKKKKLIIDIPEEKDEGDVELLKNDGE